MGQPQRKTIGEGDPKTPLLDRLVFWKQDLPILTGKSARTINRWISSGEFPKHDASVSGRPLWRRETLQDWSRGA